MSQQGIIPVSHRIGCDVVVIDDYEVLATEISEALRRQGISAQLALDGATALALALNCQPRVALVDCGLPDIDGIELIRQLGQLWPQTTFLVISGQVGGVSEDMARQLRIHAFLNKPLPMRVLAQTVEKLVRTPPARRANQGTRRGWFALGLGSPAGSALEMSLTVHPERGWPR